MYDFTGENDITDSHERKKKIMLEERICHYIRDKYKDQKNGVEPRIAKELGVTLMKATILWNKANKK